MKELTKKCIGLISQTLVELGQTKSDKDVLILSTTLANDLIRDFKTLTWEDIENAWRQGVRTSKADVIVINVPNYYRWIKEHKRLIDEDKYAQMNKESYSSRKELRYRSKSNKLLTLKTLLNESNIKSEADSRSIT
tara:strand:+ start:788 stop:1195 length:408 start_codon:yes stop_codon:yes gene_type:complete